MKALSLNIKERTAGQAEKDRAEGFIPAVLYGPKEASTPASVSTNDFLKVWNEAGESTIVTLRGIKEDKDSLIHEVAVHPVSGKPLHIDFYVIEKGKKVSVDVPLSFVGVAPIEKSGEGIIIKVIHEIEVEAMPRDLPHEIEVDLSGLAALDGQILVKDLKLPEGVLASLAPEEVVVSVNEAKEIEEEEPTSEVDIASIEVEEKGKKEDGEPTEGKTKTESSEE